MRVFLLTIFAFIISGCGVLERPTGYSANPSLDNGYLIETCDESEFEGGWLAFETDNVIANTFVPAYRDYCTYLSPDFVFFWNLEEQYGFYNYDFEWECENETTMKIEESTTGDTARVKIFGLLQNDCYSVKVSYNGKSANGEICPCEYNGP